MDKPNPPACERCFSDEKLVVWIREKGQPGACQWCGSSNVQVISLERLAEVFDSVVSMYEETSSGEPIEQLLQEDWQVFSEQLEVAPDGRMRGLALAILTEGYVDPSEDPPDYRGLFRRVQEWLEDLFDDTIMSHLDQPTVEEINQGHAVLGAALEDMARDFAAGRVWYRARIHKNRVRADRFSRAEMGAPPVERARAGRGNKEGKPVLYLASDETTAVAEVRGWKGSGVAVAEVRLLRAVRVVDVTEAQPLESPFLTDEDVPWRIQMAGALLRMGADLARPVMPHEEPTLYRPTQLLCDLIQRERFDGICYPSAQGPGFNLLLFDVTAAVAEEPRYVRIESVSYALTPLTNAAPIYDASPYDYLLLPGCNCYGVGWLWGHALPCWLQRGWATIRRRWRSP